MSTLVLSVDKVEFALSPLMIFPPRLMLRASGQVATSHWTNGRLEPRFDEDEAATLNTLKFDFVATPPSPGTIVSEVLKPIFASYTFGAPPLAATKIIIVAKTNKQELDGVPEPFRSQITAPVIPGLPDPIGFNALAAPEKASNTPLPRTRRQGVGQSVKLSFEEALQAALHDLDKQPSEVQGSDILFTTRVVSITTFSGGFVGNPLTLEVVVEDTTLPIR